MRSPRAAQAEPDEIENFIKLLEGRRAELAVERAHTDHRAPLLRELDVGDQLDVEVDGEQRQLRRGPIPRRLLLLQQFRVVPRRGASGALRAQRARHTRLPGEPHAAPPRIPLAAESGWREPPDIGYALGVAPSKPRLTGFLALTAGLVCAAGCATTPKSTCPTPSVAERWKEDESPYKEYFAAIRKAAAAEWVPQIKGLETTGLFEVGKCQHATLLVTTDADGAVVDQRVCRPSDSFVLDDTAMKAMREAKSFGPVPPGLLRPDGRFRFTFSFFLYCRVDKANVDVF